MESVISIFGIILKVLFVFFFFGFCVFIHELGHLLVAKWRGLHVEKFSVGFGHAIYSWRKDNIDYQVGWLPFGGYVALPQLDPSSTPKTSDGTPLPLSHPIDRILTAFAGPLFNVFFGFFLASIVWQVGIEGPAPADFFTVGFIPETYLDDQGNVHSNPEFTAGLREGDTVVAVNGKTFGKGWEEAVKFIVFASNGHVVLDVIRGNERIKISYQQIPNPQHEGLGYPFFHPFFSIRIGDVLENSPAEKIGLKSGDILEEINGENIFNSRQFIQRLQEKGSQPITLKVQRNHQELVFRNVIPEEKMIDQTKKYVLGISLEFVPRERVILHPSPWEQFKDVIIQTGETLGGLVDTKNPIQAKHMSGPVGIFQIIYLVLDRAGFMAAISLIIMISFSLAIINLFPIPVLDGGHIMLGIMELVLRKRIPEKVVQYFSYAFVILLLSFMAYVTYYDILRVSRSFRPALETFTKDKKSDNKLGESQQEDKKDKKQQVIKDN